MIIGRHSELARLKKIYNTNEAEFLVVYGRRRVGKTYLIREYFRNNNCIFVHTTGIQHGKMQRQLQNFTNAIAESFYNGAPLAVPKTWELAFELLHKQIIKFPQQKIVIFLDELPWLATKKSGLLDIIDYYWNRHWSAMNNIILIACGSSASWLINKIIYNTGGLHNRITCQIKLDPFDLCETKEYLLSRNIKLNHKNITNIYLALGGIPYYLKYLEPGITAAQNIQQLLFDKNAPLQDEFNKLFRSLFENEAVFVEIIKLLATRKLGLSRTELVSQAKLSGSGGRLSTRLEDLCVAGFIEKFTPWQKNTGEYYKLSDEFCLFYLTWIDKQQAKIFTNNHWINQANKQGYKIWSGFAFEALCYKHIDIIIKTLNIPSGGIVYSWKYIARNDSENGTQIDLLIDRNDDTITLCEIKYTDAPFKIDKQYAAILRNKIAVFINKTKTTKQVFLAMITANGLANSKYADELVDSVVTLDDLFNYTN